MAQAIRQEHPEFPVDLEALQRATPAQGLDTFFQWFQNIAPAETQLEYYCWIAEKQVERLKAQGVRYAEWMLPAGSLGLRGDLQEAVERVAVLRQRVDACEQGQTQVEFVICLGRNRPAEYQAQILPTLLALRRAGLAVGVGLAGPEIGYPVKPFARLLAQIHDAGLGIEVHAGEWCGPESVWDALENGSPARIGHGVSLFRDPRLVGIFQERQIHIEMCPTSNWRTGSVSRLEDHPVALARQMGLNFSINTDDPGAFACSMDSEYALLVDIFGFTVADFESIYRNSLAARFQPALRVVN